MRLISDEELSALEALERMYGVLNALVERYGIEPEASSIAIRGRYSNGTSTIAAVLDRADEVLERAKARKLVP